jgi:ascorbate PTS system EIIB component
VKIVTLCGAGIGTSAILKVAVERVLTKYGLKAEVVATDVEHVQQVADDAQVILSTPEHLAHIGRTYAQVISITNILDQEELASKLVPALE